MSENEMPRNLVTAKEAAKLLGVCQDTLRKLAKDGKIYREPRSVGSPFYLYDAFSFLSSVDDTVVIKKKEIVVYLEEQIKVRDKNKEIFLNKQIELVNTVFPDYKMMVSHIKSFPDTNKVFNDLLDMVLTKKVSTIILFRSFQGNTPDTDFFIIRKFFSLLGVEIINLDIHAGLTKIHKNNMSNTYTFSKYKINFFTDDKKNILKCIKPKTYIVRKDSKKHVCCAKAAKLLNISKMSVLRRGKKGVLNTIKDPVTGIIKYLIDAPSIDSPKKTIAYYVHKNSKNITDYKAAFATIITGESYCIYTDTKYNTNFSSLFKIMGMVISRQVGTIYILDIMNLSDSYLFTIRLEAIFLKLGCRIIYC